MNLKDGMNLKEVWNDIIHSAAELVLYGNTKQLRENLKYRRERKYWQGVDKHVAYNF